jgi:spore germination cell wall hydrolase CwlJ-like protein
MLESILCLALALYHEARSETIDAQLLVAEVIMNRVKHEDFPATICEVVYQPKQFAWSDKDLPITEAVFLDSVTMAGEVYWGYTELPGTKALFFHSGPRKGFFKTRKRIGRYGEHTFYE